MTAASAERSDRVDPVFLVERYVTLASAAGLPASVARTARLCEASGARAATAPTVHYLTSTYMPTEDTCFCLFRAPTAAAVQAVNDEAGFAMDRITAAVLLHQGISKGRQRHEPDAPSHDQAGPAMTSKPGPGTASLSDPPVLTVVQPSQGDVGWLGAVGVQFKLSGDETNGSVSVVEHPFPVGAMVVPHMHTREDEYSIVTAGEIGFRSGDREVVLGPGGYITKPRGEMHGMWNAGSVPAHMIEIISPSGFENFFRELSEVLAAGPPDIERITALAASYGVQFGEPEWLPDVLTRYQLTPPPM